MSEKNQDLKIDRISFQLGMINCFVEMVACGVKKLALSPPLLPEDYKKIETASQDITAGFNIKSYLEKSLLITGLQTEDFTKGKWSMTLSRIRFGVIRSINALGLRRRFILICRSSSWSR